MRQTPMRNYLLLSMLIFLAPFSTSAIAADQFDAVSFSATAVSDDGNAIAGTAKDKHGKERAFLWNPVAGMVDIGTLPGDDGSRVIAISGDGHVIVGWSVSSNPIHDHLFYWSKSSGMIDLGTLPEDTLPGISAVSHDGSVVVGWAKNKDGKSHAFRWTKADGLKDLGTLPGDINSEASSVSANGEVIVGNSSKVVSPGKTLKHAFFWTQAGGMVDLGSLSGTSNSYADEISADGTVAVGGSYEATNDVSFEIIKHATIWKLSGGMIDIGTLPGDSYSNARYLSSDGKVIVGASYARGTSMHSFRWTQETGVVPLGILPGKNNSIVQGISADGSAAAGYDLDAGNPIPFLWTQVDDLTYIGSSPGSKLAFIHGLSLDGKTVIGQCFEDLTQFNHAHACRWNQKDGMVDLGTFRPVSNHQNTP